MAANAVVRRGASVALACRAFGVSETCYRYGPKLKVENEEIADLLVGLTDARKTWGFGLCFLHLRNVKGHPWNHKRVYRIYCALVGSTGQFGPEPPLTPRRCAAPQLLHNGRSCTAQHFPTSDDGVRKPFCRST